MPDTAFPEHANVSGKSWKFGDFGRDAFEKTPELLEF
jgi:hypothetical protein